MWRTSLNNVTSFPASDVINSSSVNIVALWIMDDFGTGEEARGGT